MLLNRSRATMLLPTRPANDTGPVANDTGSITLRLLTAEPRRCKSRENYQSRLAPWQLKRVTEFINANLAETLQLCDLAALSGLSPSHFGRAFKGSTGLPPHRWHLVQRIERARAMLTDAEASLADVACATGFADQSHFTRVFSRTIGMSPGAWRRRSHAA
ncbi:MAG TPA: AraC family transcriptional regulator [Alphaproteobacteria bacterium]|jgi:transcriptional regulator GlxA family with amidase domain|nr:AraC family transcriptional regulator [Alphaproteobacteria bacterium]